MPNRNRRAFRTIAFLILAALGAQAVAAGGWWLWGYKQEYNRQRVPDTEQSPKGIEGICLKLPPVLFLCPSDDGGVGEARRDSDDLKAQQEMADWAFAMVALTAAGFALSSVGIVLIYATFKATQRGNKINRTVGEAQVRAYVSVVTTPVPTVNLMQPTHAPETRFRLKNFGNSPASKVNICYRIGYSTGSTTRAGPPMVITPWNLVFDNDISAGGEIPMHHIHGHFLMTDEERAHPLVSLNVTMLLRYVDVFGRRHEETQHWIAPLVTNPAVLFRVPFTVMSLTERQGR